MDYINLYNDTYAEAEKTCENSILKKIKKYKKDKRNYNFCSNNLLEEFRVIEKEFRVLQPPYKDLCNFYEKRADEFEPEYYMEVIPQTLLPKFKKIIHEDENFTFGIFVKELAKANAFKNCYRIFSNNYSIFQMMFKLNRFDEFKLDESLGRESSVFYEKYRLLLYPDNVSFNSSVTINNNLKDQKSKNKEEIKNFDIKNKWLLDDDNYYHTLTYDFINEEKTSFEDFKNVLLKDFGSHKSEIHFFCKNYFARELILSFQKKFEGKMNLSNAALSEKFRASTGIIFKRSNLSKSNKTSEVITPEILDLLQ